MPGRLLVADGVTNDILVLDSYSGKLVRRLTGHAKRPLVFVKLNSDYVTSISEDGTIRRWNIESGKPEIIRAFDVESIQPIEMESFALPCEVSPSGNLFAFPGPFGIEIQLIDLRHEGSQSTISLIGEDATLYWPSFGSGDDTLFVAIQEGDMLPLNTSNSVFGERFESRFKGSTHAGLSLDGRRLVTSRFGGQVIVSDVRSARPVLKLSRHASAAWAIAWSPDGRRVAAGFGEGMVTIWSTGNE